MKHLIVANWKMHLAPGEAQRLLAKIQNGLPSESGTDVVVCPPFVDLPGLKADLLPAKVKLGAQNLHARDDGPFTGEISGPMLKGLVTHVIVGHSERRAMGETDKDVAAKLAAAVRNGLTPILCVGETLHEREHDLSLKVVTDQVTAALTGLTAHDIAGIVVAYEPIWAINHGPAQGRPATPDEIAGPVQAIHRVLEDLYGEAGGASTRVLYGGSSSADNCRAYLGADGIDGLLVGGDSLVAADFLAIVAAAKAAAV